MGFIPKFWRVEERRSAWGWPKKPAPGCCCCCCCCGCCWDGWKPACWVYCWPCGATGCGGAYHDAVGEEARCCCCAGAGCFEERSVRIWFIDSKWPPEGSRRKQYGHRQIRRRVVRDSSLESRQHLTERRDSAVEFHRRLPQTTSRCLNIDHIIFIRLADCFRPKTRRMLTWYGLCCPPIPMLPVCAGGAFQPPCPPQFCCCWNCCPPKPPY